MSDEEIEDAEEVPGDDVPEGGPDRDEEGLEEE